jgi:hypothetical protein
MRNVDPAKFWSLIEDTRRAADGDPHEHAAVLRRRLERLGPEAILAFEHHWRVVDVAAYRWDLWAAAYLLNGGCDDQCFDDFRAYLIGLGRKTYEDALADPDNLAVLAFLGPSTYQFAHDGAPLAYAAEEAYLALTGEEVPDDLGPQLPEEPAGEPFDLDAPELVVPKIAAAVGWIET